MPHLQCLSPEGKISVRYGWGQVGLSHTLEAPIGVPANTSMCAQCLCIGILAVCQDRWSSTFNKPSPCLQIVSAWACWQTMCQDWWGSTLNKPNRCSCKHLHVCTMFLHSYIGIQCVNIDEDQHSTSPICVLANTSMCAQCLYIYIDILADNVSSLKKISNHWAKNCAPANTSMCAQCLYIGWLADYLKDTCHNTYTHYRAQAWLFGLEALGRASRTLILLMLQCSYSLNPNWSSM